MSMFNCCKRVEIRPNVVITNPEGHHFSQSFANDFSSEENNSNFSIATVKSTLAGLQAENLQSDYSKFSPTNTPRTRQSSRTSSPSGTPQTRRSSIVNVEINVHNTAGGDSARELPDTEAKLITGTTPAGNSLGILGSIVNTLRLFIPFS